MIIVFFILYQVLHVLTGIACINGCAMVYIHICPSHVYLSLCCRGFLGSFGWGFLVIGVLKVLHNFKKILYDWFHHSVMIACLTLNQSNSGSNYVCATRKRQINDAYQNGCMG